jgi:hypothetical protein
MAWTAITITFKIIAGWFDLNLLFLCVLVRRKV